MKEKIETGLADIVVIAVLACEVKVQVLALRALPQATISISLLLKNNTRVQVYFCFFVYLHFLRRDTWYR